MKIKKVCYNKLDFRWDVIILTEKDIICLIEKILDNKFTKDRNFIKYTFYELRVKLNLSELELYHFLRLIEIKLENLGYKVYLTGDTYILRNNKKIVRENELLIAIKGKENNEFKEQSKRKRN